MKTEIMKTENKKEVLDFNTVKNYLSMIGGINPERVNIECTNNKVRVTEVSIPTLVNEFLVNTGTERYEIININGEPHVREKIILDLLEKWIDFSSEKVLIDMKIAQKREIMSDSQIDQLMRLSISVTELKKLQRREALEIIQKDLNYEKELKNIMNLCYYEVEDLICLKSYQLALTTTLNI